MAVTQARGRLGLDVASLPGGKAPSPGLPIRAAQSGLPSPRTGLHRSPDFMGRAVGFRGGLSHLFL